MYSYSNNNWYYKLTRKVLCDLTDSVSDWERRLRLFWIINILSWYCHCLCEQSTCNWSITEIIKRLYKVKKNWLYTKTLGIEVQMTIYKDYRNWGTADNMQRLSELIICNWSTTDNMHTMRNWSIYDNMQRL